MLCALTALLLLAAPSAAFFRPLGTTVRLRHSAMASNNETTASSLARPGPAGFGSPEEWEQERAKSSGIIPTNGNVNDGGDAGQRERDANLSPGALRYFKLMDGSPPNELLLKFARTAPPSVQEAARSTVVNLLGSLPNYALDASLITTNTKLASLLYQMQITGYMFKNAEYRYSMTRALKACLVCHLPRR